MDVSVSGVVVRHPASIKAIRQTAVLIAREYNFFTSEAQFRPVVLKFVEINGSTEPSEKLAGNLRQGRSGFNQI